ncbi:hypothetical protein [Bacillus sp. CDB3]|uniref:hypothetical protein n=1 Tax=Bacillus sp. CDB3 TaxID=360310 RepID=UPI0009D871E8|nr:hypothetical protein [Bacillus sp. CDB3]OQR53109.1 hypothetical protein CDB3_31990 [Bacillus sp. CDB3]
MDKFNAFDKAMKEKKMKEHNQNTLKPKKPAMNIPQGKERKEQMSLMFTPSHKEKARKIAGSHNMSVSELFAFWLDQYDN